VAVPQLRGKPLDQAQAALGSAGLTVTVKGVNANVDKNVVADQSPDVGSALAPGSTVTLMVGSGSTVVPDVNNMPRDQAAKALQSNSFRVVVRQRSDQRAPGVAIGTVPPAGSVQPRGSEIELDISRGRD
jgi:serine/threonine-protein kinase